MHEKILLIGTKWQVDFFDSSRDHKEEPVFTMRRLIAKIRTSPSNWLLCPNSMHFLVANEDCAGTIFHLSTDGSSIRIRGRVSRQSNGSMDDHFLAEFWTNDVEGGAERCKDVTVNQSPDRFMPVRFTE